MNLYESLIKNVGIGKEALVRQWIKDNTRASDDAWKDITYKDGKISYSYIDLFLKDELPDYIVFDNIRYISFNNMNRQKKLKVNADQLPKKFDVMSFSDFDLTNTTINTNPIPTDNKEICISGCICKNTVIDAPYANLLLYSLDGIVKGVSSKNATGIQLTDQDMAKLISKLKGDIDSNVRKIFKKFPEVEKITSTSLCISKAGGKWILD